MTASNAIRGLVLLLAFALLAPSAAADYTGGTLGVMDQGQVFHQGLDAGPAAELFVQAGPGARRGAAGQPNGQRQEECGVAQTDHDGNP